MNITLNNENISSPDSAYFKPNKPGSRNYMRSKKNFGSSGDCPKLSFGVSDAKRIILTHTEHFIPNVDLESQYPTKRQTIDYLADRDYTDLASLQQLKEQIHSDSNSSLFEQPKYEHN